MIKTAFATEDRSSVAALRVYGKMTDEHLPTEKKSSSGRFPPIENTLTEIIKNKRLAEAHDNV